MRINLTDEIYNPRDIWKTPYFIVSGEVIYRNPECKLSEKDYKALCEIYGVSPIYPSNVLKEPGKENISEMMARKRQYLSPNFFP